MALQASTPSELIAIDNNYLARVTDRRRILAEHSPTVLGVTPPGHAPIRELYAYLLGTYLPARYPGMFQLVHHDDPGATAARRSFSVSFRNRVTNLVSPLQPPPADPLEMLRILGETVEDDLFLLVRDTITTSRSSSSDDSDGGNGSNDQTGGEHRVVAFVCCHPSGFDPSEKLGKRLADVHGPVPSYERIGPSMERFFARLEAGKGVKRVNWALQTHSSLFAPSGNHVQDGDEVKDENRFDPQTARFRAELQSLTRLPETRAILFSFKTYLYPLEDIKAEGLGHQLADAVEGLKAGNAPGMWEYKGAVRWGKAACEYLRS
ncbi:hypothetical protein VTK26DRAFT_1280 [Humicola hyalothermophila]